SLDSSESSSAAGVPPQPSTSAQNNEVGTRPSRSDIDRLYPGARHIASGYASGPKTNSGTTTHDGDHQARVFVMGRAIEVSEQLDELEPGCLEGRAKLRGEQVALADHPLDRLLATDPHVQVGDI